MAPAAAFTEVLDQVVGRFQPSEPLAAGRPHPGITTRSLFWFEGATSMPNRVPPITTPATARAGTLHSENIETVVRSGRSLTSQQRDALDRFGHFGANLRADYTRDELRSAFRSLARCFHPDRHPGMGPAEKERLAATFSLLKTAYEELRRAA
jgi:hypothetical protein